MIHVDSFTNEVTFIFLIFVLFLGSRGAFCEVRPDDKRILEFYSKLGCFEIAKMEGFPKDVVILGRSLWHLLALWTVGKSLNFTWWVVVGVFIQFSLWSGNRSADWDWKQRRLCKTHHTWRLLTGWNKIVLLQILYGTDVGLIFGSCVRCQDLLHGLIDKGSPINVVSTVFCIQCDCISHLRVIKTICHSP